MGLLDEAREKASRYITPKDFLCYISHKLGDPIEDIASFLLHNYFDEKVCEYYIDRHYRIYDYDDICCEYKTGILLREITKDGFFNYMMFCNEFFDDCLSTDDDLGFYVPIRIDFYYSIDALEEISFIKELNLDLKSSSSLDYTVYSNDTVKAEKSRNQKLFKLIGLKDHFTVEDVEPSTKEYGYHSPVGISKSIIYDEILALTMTKYRRNEVSTLELQSRITDLEDQLAQAKAKLANQPIDDIQLQGIFKYNVDKAYIISTSKALANYIWSMDTNKMIRTGDMVQQIRHVMHNVAPSLLPDNKAIRGWLSDIAPDYAKKGGKPSKNTSDEISLIMKK